MMKKIKDGKMLNMLSNQVNNIELPKHVNLITHLIIIIMTIFLCPTKCTIFVKNDKQLTNIKQVAK